MYINDPLTANRGVSYLLGNGKHNLAVREEVEVLVARLEQAGRAERRGGGGARGGVCSGGAAEGGGNGSGRGLAAEKGAAC